MYQFGEDKIFPGCYSFLFSFIFIHNYLALFYNSSEFFKANIYFKLKGEILLKKDKFSKIKILVKFI